jgi:hypothetical protein
MTISSGRKKCVFTTQPPPPGTISSYGAGVLFWPSDVYDMKMSSAVRGALT